MLYIYGVKHTQTQKTHKRTTQTMLLFKTNMFLCLCCVTQKILIVLCIFCFHNTTHNKTYVLLLLLLCVCCCCCCCCCCLCCCVCVLLFLFCFVVNNQTCCCGLCLYLYLYVFAFLFCKTQNIKQPHNTTPQTKTKCFCLFVLVHKQKVEERTKQQNHFYKYLRECRGGFCL